MNTGALTPTAVETVSPDGLDNPLPCAAHGSEDAALIPNEVKA